MRHTIVTMTRGDSLRIEDWLRYHCSIGFDDFYLILDAPNDNTEDVLRRINLPAKITIDVRAPFGDYYENLSSSERFLRVKQWRIDHAEEIQLLGLPANDALSMRQYKYFPEILEYYRSLGDGWLSLLDVDEYIVLRDDLKISELTLNSDCPRLRFLNFNVGMIGWLPGRAVRRQTMRWSREDVLKYAKGWENRVKSLVRYDSTLPIRSVHSISSGQFHIFDESVARLLHYRYPDQGIDIPYSIRDTSALERMELFDDKLI